MSKIVASINAITKIMSGESEQEGRVYGGARIAEFELTDRKMK